MNTEQLILQKLEKIEQKVDRIEEHIEELDMFLSAEEKQLLEESFVNEKEGKLLSSSDLKKQLGL